MKHEQVISTITNGESLRNINTVVCSNRLKQGSFLMRVNDRVSWDKFTRQSLRRRVNFELWADN